jgi:hypothetical protein
MHIAFAVEPLVVQIRNPHTYLADFDAEQDLYYKSGKLIEFLGHWNSSSPDLTDHIKELYVELYERAYIGATDVRMIKLWLDELLRIGYRFPVVCYL